MILLEDILHVHEFSISKFGGSNGIREVGSLESAIARPFQSFDGNDLYPTIFDKAAALGESLIVNHPFIDEINGLDFWQCFHCLKTMDIYYPLRKMKLIISPLKSQQVK